MRKIFRTIFAPLLKIFESGSDPYIHKSSNRVILIVVGGLFCGLAAFGLWLAMGADPGYLLPVFIFGGAGLVCLLVGVLGTDRAVAKLWGSK